MTVETLKDCNKKILARMAKDQGIAGWHAMRKDQLIRALVPPSSLVASAKKEAAQDTAPKVTPPGRSGPAATASAPAAARRPGVTPPRTLEHACVKDRIIMMVRDPYWLHAYWELSRATLARAQAAMGQDWHTARPILRLMDVTSEETTSASERAVRDIEIHGGVNNWYIDVTCPPRSYRIDIGYLSRRGKFFILARSNVVSTPRAGASDVLDQNWASVQEEFQRFLSQAGGPTLPAGLQELMEERAARPMVPLSFHGLGTGALPCPGRSFHFEVEAELVVYGSTEPGARVTLQGEPVPVHPDGTFTVRFSLPDSRQIIPAVAASADGVEERTIVLAIERNTKELEPMIHDGNEL
jgi:hypothetical protein